MTYSVPESVNTDLSQPAIVHSAEQEWSPSPTAGVDRRFLERDGAEVARASSVVRYAPGSAFPEHTHDMGEEYLVLEGVFSDGDGDFRTGCYVRNPPGSKHAPFTKDGCTIFVKLRQADRGELSGEEIFVIEGELLYGDTLCGAGTWLRFPAGEELPIQSPSGCRIWAKRGHLGHLT